jgi:hypothetical protein
LLGPADNAGESSLDRPIRAVRENPALGCILPRVITRDRHEDPLASKSTDCILDGDRLSRIIRQQTLAFGRRRSSCSVSHRSSFGRSQRLHLTEIIAEARMASLMGRTS